MITLFESGTHKNVMFSDLSSGLLVQTNQHLIIDGVEGMLLDPGGYKVYPQLLSRISSIFSIKRLKYVFFSHQDPDVIASASGWFAVTDAEALISSIWMRFVPHFGMEEWVSKRLRPIPDKGMNITLGNTVLKAIPAHFLHSPGNFQLYDPASKILYSGDLGASLGSDYSMIDDFNAHIKYMQGFHKRYIPSVKPLRMWANTVRSLDFQMMAPQHGAVFPSRELIDEFIEWVENFACGLDLMGDSFPIPE
jgi:flavorubredoxin